MIRFILAPILFVASFGMTPLKADQGGEVDDGGPEYLLLPPSEIARIQSVIAAQVQAFRAGDVAQAFTYASPSIQETFGDAQTFGQMVQGGYGQIFSAYNFRFDELIGTMDAPVQVVYFTGTDLTVIAAFYAMVLVPGEGWRINGVQIFPVDQQAS